MCLTRSIQLQKKVFFFLSRIRFLWFGFVHCNEMTMYRSRFYFTHSNVYSRGKWKFTSHHFEFVYATNNYSLNNQMILENTVDDTVMYFFYQHKHLCYPACKNTHIQINEIKYLVVLHAFIQQWWSGNQI